MRRSLENATRLFERFSAQQDWLAGHIINIARSEKESRAGEIPKPSRKKRPHYENRNHMTGNMSNQYGIVVAFPRPFVKKMAEPEVYTEYENLMDDLFSARPRKKQDRYNRLRRGLKRGSDRYKQERKRNTPNLKRLVSF